MTKRQKCPKCRSENIDTFLHRDTGETSHSCYDCGHSWWDEPEPPRRRSRQMRAKATMLDRAMNMVKK